MITINETKKNEIINFLKKNKEKWFTLNQIRNQIEIHIYKAETLMYQLLLEDKVQKDEKASFVFWRIK
jgi:hypothetical protein